MDTKILLSHLKILKRCGVKCLVASSLDLCSSSLCGSPTACQGVMTSSLESKELEYEEVIDQYSKDCLP